MKNSRYEVREHLEDALNVEFMSSNRPIGEARVRSRALICNQMDIWIGSNTHAKDLGEHPLYYWNIALPYMEHVARTP